jgi:hypothetical protein
MIDAWYARVFVFNEVSLVHKKMEGSSVSLFFLSYVEHSVRVHGHNRKHKHTHVEEALEFLSVMKRRRVARCCRRRWKTGKVAVAKRPPHPAQHSARDINLLHLSIG